MQNTLHPLMTVIHNIQISYFRYLQTLHLPQTINQMKSETFLPTKQQNKVIKHTVIKGSQNIPYDANVMAQIQQQKSYQEQLNKKTRMESFLNQTRLNASKLYRERTEKNMEKQNSKKAILQKQKDLKSKYTMMKKPEINKIEQELKKGQSAKNIKVQPTKVDWKKSTQTNIDKVRIPQEKLVYDEESDGDMSAIDSDIDHEKEANPKDMLKVRQSIRNAMLNKFSLKK